MRELTPLCLLAKKYETDKGGRHNRYGGGDSETCHEYTPIYHDLFGYRRQLVRNVFEIGINSGASLQMWADYFPNAIIYGIDSDQAPLDRVEAFGHSRIKAFACDQNNPRELMQVLGKIDRQRGDVTMFDLIVDDGSHELAHQIVSMKTLLPFLAADGHYIIEDLQQDCRPDLVGIHVPAGYTWMARQCERGTGKAYACGCGCGEPERLLVIHHG